MNEGSEKQMTELPFYMLTNIFGMYIQVRVKISKVEATLPGPKILGGMALKNGDGSRSRTKKNKILEANGCIMESASRESNKVKTGLLRENGCRRENESREVEGKGVGDWNWQDEYSKI